MEHRSPAVGVAVSTVPVAPGRDHHRPARNRDPLAPTRFPCLFALEVPPRRPRIDSGIRALIRLSLLKTNPRAWVLESIAIERGEPVTAGTLATRDYQLVTERNNLELQFRAAAKPRSEP